MRRWEHVDVRVPWDGFPKEVIRVCGRHFSRSRAMRVARYYDGLTRQPCGDRATYRIMVRDRETGALVDPYAE